MTSGRSGWEDARPVDQLGVFRPGDLVAGRARERHAELLAASGVAREHGRSGGVGLVAIAPLTKGSRASARDFAYQPGGHAPAMKRAREVDTHRAGVYLRVRPLASTGNLGIEETALPELPDADR